MASSITRLRKFVAPEIIFGEGARRAVANYVSTFGAERVLLVSDPGVVLAGWVAEVEADLAAQGIACRRFTSVSPNPRSEEVMAGAEAYREMGAQAIVAIGGGSPMDCAKGIGIVVAPTRARRFWSKASLPISPSASGRARNCWRSTHGLRRGYASVPSAWNSSIPTWPARWPSGG